MKTLTGMGGTGNARELAEMLRQLGRGRDTILAHITPEEAQMLMDMGGSGKINPNTGLPEFQEEFDIGFGPGRYSPDYTAQDVQGAPYEDVAQYYSQPSDFYGSIDRGATAFDQVQQLPPGLRYQTEIPVATRRVDITEPVYREPFAITPREFLPEVPQEPGLLQQGAQGIENTAARMRELARQYPTVARLLGTGATTLPSLVQAMRARRDAQRSAEEFRRLGAPMREQGEALRQQALAGRLTPQQAQQQEAERARARQAASSRGVTSGTQQAMIEAQLARQRAALSETNLNNAIKMLNLANAYDEEAIRSKLAADQRINQMVGNIFANLGSTAAASAGVGGATEQRPAVTRRPEVPRG